MLTDLSKDETAAESRGEASLHVFSLVPQFLMGKAAAVSEGVSLLELKMVAFATLQLLST